MDTLSANEALDRLQSLIRNATEEKRQYRITSEHGNVILLPEETYENILVTLELLSTPGLMDHMRGMYSDDEFEESYRMLPHASN